MKYFLNILLAFCITWLTLCAAAEYVQYTPLRTAIFSLSFHTYVIFWWVVFSFPQYVGRTASQVGSWIYEFLAYILQITHQLLTHLWKYRMGQLAIGALLVYLLYQFCIPTTLKPF